MRQYVNNAEDFAEAVRLANRNSEAEKKIRDKRG